MSDQHPLVCPICSAGRFVLKHEATYVYSYLVDSSIDAPGLKNDAEFLPFLYDDREQKSTKQYVECSGCGTAFPIYFDHWDSRVGISALQDAINASTIHSK